MKYVTESTGADGGGWVAVVSAMPDSPPPTPEQPPNRDIVDEYRKKELERTETASWQRLAASTTEFAGAILLGVGGGWAVDHWLDSSPWGLIIGTALGFAAGLYLLIRAAAGSFK